jgi:sterol desaturase/sphingolipid hydroxylase (fatty acid hydroxylase superfamily)
MALIPVLLAALVISRDSIPGSIAVIFLVIFSFALFFTNEIHKWAHRENVSRPVAWLQRSGLILSPAHHAAHHTAPFNRRYCITAGWLNLLLDGTGFFRALERAVTFATGAEPRSYA